MPAIDHCHEQVKHALQKENWSITSDPYTITLPDRFLYIDLEAQRGSNGQTEQIILVEVKCFSSVNRITHDLYVAIGQYVTYRVAITQLGL
ncbi:MAG: element excision factor XisH family protein, partial [Chloroflexota bacterium]